MRSRLSRLSLITMAMVLGVGLCGGAFASWTDDVVVHGTVSTGEVDLVIVDTSETFVYKILSTGGIVVLEEEMNDPDYKLIASARVIADDDDVLNDTATVLFDNLFPGPLFKADLLIHYYGVPAHVTLENFDVAPPELAPYVWWEIVWPDGTTSSGAMDTLLFIVDGYYQVHECEEFEVNIYAQLPQDPAVQGLTGSVSFAMKAVQWNLCEPVVQKELDLPTTPVHLVLQGAYSPTLDSYSDPRSYFDAYFSNVPAGYEWLEVGNPWPAWCVEFESSSVMELDVTLVSTMGVPSWDSINYLLNQPAYRDPPYNYDGLTMTVGGFSGVMTHSARQRAYWSYQPGGWSPPAADISQVLIADANANSAGFIPGPGQLAAVICQDGSSYQTVFVEIDP